MLIKKAEIISFGKFKNKTLEFDKGLNIICGDNESGKSTVISFIYAMIYGFGESRGKGLSLREKYTPWNGGSCEGKLILTTPEGNDITIYRKAGIAKKYDILKVYDSVTARESALSPSELVGVNSDTFFRTLCVKQLACVTDGGNDEILQKLSNIAQSGDENISYEKASKILESCRREICPVRGAGGELSRINNQIAVSENEVSKAREIEAGILKARELLKKENEKLSSLNEQYDRLSSEFSTTGLGAMQSEIAQDKEPSNKFRVTFYLFSLILFIVTLICSMIKPSVAVFPFAAACVLCIFGLSYSIRKKKKRSYDYSADLISFQKKKEEQNALLRALQKDILEKEKIVMHLHSEIKYLTEKKPDSSGEKLENLYIQKKLLEKKLNAIDLARSALDMASSRLKNNFTPAITNKASEYFALLCNHKYDRIFCNENFAIKVDADIPRESQYFSGGCNDQMYLALRLALTDMIFGDKSTFMLFDQPFVQYDEKRKKSALQLLETLSDNRQIILFENSVESFSANKKTEMLT